MLSPLCVKPALFGHLHVLDYRDSADAEVDSFLNSARRKQQKNTPQYKGVFSVF